MIRIPDLLVLAVLQEGERMIYDNLDVMIPMIFGNIPAEAQDGIKDFMVAGRDSGNPEEAAKYRIKMFLGYPSSEQELPCLSVTIESEQESTQAIGDIIEDATGNMGTDPTANWIHSGAFFDGVYKIACYSINPDLTAYLQAMVKFILLYYREAMGKEGLIKQRVSCSDIRVAPEGYPSMTLIREVRLSCSYINGWIETVHPLEEISLNPTWLTPDGIDMGD